MDGNITLRRACTKDYEAVERLETLIFLEHRRARPDYFKEDLAQGYSRKEFEELLANPSPIAWLAERDGQIVGLCFGRIEETKEHPICKRRRIAFIEDLVTLPGYRKQGIGTALMRQAREQARQADAEALELCVWGFNRDALRFYEQMGLTMQYCRMEEKLNF